MPYVVALKHKHGACASLLDPTLAEPLVWPSPLKFISELNQEAKVLLEQALMEANKEREKNILKGTAYSLWSPLHSDAAIDDNMSEDSDTDLCCICFDQVCTIEVQDCGYRMCAQCTLALCCHNKPNPTTACLSAPVCPFFRSTIARLVVAKIKAYNDIGDISSSKLKRSRRSQNFSEGSSSFKGLSALGSFSKMGEGGGGVGGSGGKGGGGVGGSGGGGEKKEVIQTLDNLVTFVKDYFGSKKSGLDAKEVIDVVSRIPGLSESEVFKACSWLVENEKNVRMLKLFANDKKKGYLLSAMPHE